MQASLCSFFQRRKGRAFTAFLDFTHHAFYRFTLAALTAVSYYAPCFTSAAGACENPMADMMMAPSAHIVTFQLFCFGGSSSFYLDNALCSAFLSCANSCFKDVDGD